MAVIHWRPFPELNSMQREINRLFDSFAGSEPPEDYRGTWAPNIDIKETPDAVILIAELPGMSKEDIKLTVQDNIVQISGEKKQTEPDKNETYHRVERVHGPFCRTFTLPSVLNTSKIQAIFKDGILRVEVAKAEQIKPRQIEIKS